MQGYSIILLSQVSRQVTTDKHVERWVLCNSDPDDTMFLFRPGSYPCEELRDLCIIIPYKYQGQNHTLKYSITVAQKYHVSHVWWRKLDELPPELVEYHIEGNDVVTRLSDAGWNDLLESFGLKVY